jgi:hypothetical protein
MEIEIYKAKNQRGIKFVEKHKQYKGRNNCSSQTAHAQQHTVLNKWSSMLQADMLNNSTNIIHYLKWREHYTWDNF